MTRRVELDVESGELVVSFRFDRALKDLVKALPDSRFHWSSKTWRFPAERAATLVEALVPHGFVFVGEALAAGSGGPVAPVASGAVQRVAGPRPEAPAESERPTAEDTLTVTRLNAAVAAVVAERFAAPFWVAGTIVGFERGAHREHVWFSLAEEDGDGRPVSTVSAVLFSSARARIGQRLGAAGLELADGLSVRLFGRLEVYARRGSLQFVVEDADPAWSAGELALRREEILRELRASGLADRQLQLPMPTLPRRIALLTSVGSDAYHDVLSSLRTSGFGFEVVPFDVRVQGDGLSASVCAALERVATGRFDVAVVTRGGGSRVELSGWDDLRVARAVAMCPVKVLVAIGHHQDRSVLDEIADSAKTPTEAGEWIAAPWVRAEERLGELGVRLGSRVRRRLAVEQSGLAHRTRAIATAARQAMARHRAAVETTLPRFVAASATARIRAARARLERAEQRLTPAAIGRAISARRRALERLDARLGLAAPGTVRRHRVAVDNLAARLRLVHPDAVLRRGFAIVRDASGRPVTRAHGLASGDSVAIQMQDGSLLASVDEVTVPATPRVEAPPRAGTPNPTESSRATESSRD